MRSINTSWHPAAIFIFLLLVYLVSMPLTVALEDDGLFILSSYFNGVSHPPGYPIHSLIGKLFSMVPISTVAARVHAVSAVFGALTCVMLWVFIYSLIKDRHIANLGALSYGLSTVFWAQAIIAEVYTLNAFFFFALLYLTVRIWRLEIEPCSDGCVDKLMYATAFLFGLSLCNSWPLILLSSPGFFFLVWPTIKREPGLSIKAMPFFLVGLLPYAWMVVNSQTDPLINFMGPIDTWSKFYYFVSREIYAPFDSSESAGFIDKVYYTLFFIRELASQYTYAGFVLVVIGVVVQFEYLKKRVAFALILAFLGNSILLISVLGFDYDDLHRANIGVYFVAPYGVASIWLSLGAYYLLEYFSHYQLKEIMLRQLPVYFFVMLMMLSHFDDNYRHDYEWAEVYATKVLESLPANATFILTGDLAVGAIGYMHHIEGLRPDVKIVTDGGVVFRERIFDPFYRTIDTNWSALVEYIKDSNANIYTTAINDELFPYDYWLTRSHSSDSETNQITNISQIGGGYIDYVYGYNDNRDIWTVLHRRDLMIDSTPFILGTLALGASRRDPVKNK